MPDPLGGVAHSKVGASSLYQVFSSGCVGDDISGAVGPLEE